MNDFNYAFWTFVSSGIHQGCCSTPHTPTSHSLAPSPLLLKLSPTCLHLSPAPTHHPPFMTRTLGGPQGLLISHVSGIYSLSAGIFYTLSFFPHCSPVICVCLDFIFSYVLRNFFWYDSLFCWEQWSLNVMFGLVVRFRTKILNVQSRVRDILVMIRFSIKIESYSRGCV